MPDGEHLDSVPSWRDPVQRDVSGPTVGNDQFTHRSPDRPADVRMAFQDLNSVHDDLRGVDRGSTIDGSEKVEQAIEIG